MAEHTPTTETVRDCFVDGAAGEFIGEDFDRWLAAHDAELRAECSLLNHENRLADAAVKIGRLKAERDEAQRQLADLRAGIEALAAEYEKPNPSTLAYRSEVARAVRALAGSGEQPGECPDCGDAMCRCGIDWTAPMVPDSTDVRDLADRIETAMTDGGHRMPRTDETRYLAHVAAQTALAVVGQGVAVEWGVGYGDRHEAAPSREDAEEWIADDDAWNPGEERWLVMRQVGSWTRAAARPTGQEGS